MRTGDKKRFGLGWKRNGFVFMGATLLLGCKGSSGDLFDGADPCDTASDCKAGQECEDALCVAKGGDAGAVDGAEDASISDGNGHDGSTPDGPCIPKTCVTIGVLGGGTPCGQPWDGCGNYIDCGECEGAGEACGGAESASPNICIREGGDGGASNGDTGSDAGGDSGADGGQNSGGDAGGDGGDPSICIPDKRTGELVPLDMHLMLDRSGSMNDGGRWSSVTKALKSFVDSDDSRGMGIGLAYFPIPRAGDVPPPPAQCTANADCAPHYGDCLPAWGCEGFLLGMTDSCLAADYKAPAVSMQLLPMAISTIKSSLDKTKANGDSTPTFPALDGAHLYAREWATTHPGHVTVVVLATDGEPNNCGSTTTNTTSNIAARAEQAFHANPSIPTFVIGVGDKVGDLDTIATAGGTGHAVHLSDANAYQGFYDVLHEIRSSVKCEYRIPPPQGGELPDYDRVNVKLTAEGKTFELGRVESLAQCDPVRGGWYYDNPASPSKIMLCKQSCQLVEAGSQMSPVEVDMLLGCETTLW